MKVRYRGKFNFKSETHVLYAWAYTENQAKVIMCRRIAEIHGIGFLPVLNLFDGTRENYAVNVEP